MEEQVAASIRELAEAVKAAAPEVWAAARSAVWADVLSGVFSAVVLIGSTTAVWVVFKRVRSDFDHEPARIALGMSGGVLTVVSVVVALCAFHALAFALLAPDYAAIKLLSVLVK